MSNIMFTSQNKWIPGAYINFIGKASTVGTIGDRGVVAIGLPMSWGSGAIKVTAEQFLSGESLKLIGVDLNDALATTLPYRLAFAKANTAYFYRTNETGSTKAQATFQTDGVAKAKYAGVAGNKISFAIEAGATKFNVIIKMNGQVVEEHYDVDVTTAFESDFIEFTAVPDVPTATSSDVTLAGGTDSTTQVLTGMKTALDNKVFNTVSVYGLKTTTANNATVKGWVESWRTNGKKVQGVIYDAYTAGTAQTAADEEGVIIVHQGFVAGGETVDEDLFPIWVASMTAGCAVNESLTAAFVENGTDIVAPVDVTNYEECLKTGRFILAYRADGGIKVMKDINSYHGFTATKGYAFSKNRVVRVLDQLGNDITRIFEANYEGKQSNNKVGRTLFRNELQNICNQLYTMGAIEEPSIENITVEQGINVDAVVVTMGVQPVDSIELLYLTVNVG